MIDITKLTIGEIAKVEELSGKSIASLGEDASVSAMAALAWVYYRRTDKTLNWKQAQDQWTLADVQRILGMDQADEDEDPKDEN